MSTPQVEATTAVSRSLFLQRDADDARSGTAEVVGERDTLVPNITPFLEEAAARLSDPAVDEPVVQDVMSELFDGLSALRTHSTSAEWQQLVHVCRAHPLFSCVQQDAFTRRAFHKPRGYAGDAVLMDYIYARDDGGPWPDMTPLGRKVFDFTTNAPAAAAVRARREFIARKIDDVTAENAQAHILSVAAGHLREAGLAIAAKRRKFGRWVALDADARSLGDVTRSYGLYGVECHHASFRVMLANRHHLGNFDLIYSLGLFDYLGAASSARLLTGLFQMLRPGGVLIVGNFLPGIRDAGYMEACMDWQLVYRQRQEVLELAAEIPQTQLGCIRLETEETQQVLFLELQRA